MGGLIGLEIDNDQAVAHKTASDEFPLTVPGVDSHEDALTVEVHRWWRIPCSLNEVDPFLA